MANLTGIKFESQTAQILSISHISRVLLRWRLAPTTQNLAGTKFLVERGESPSEMAQINTGDVGDVVSNPINDHRGRRVNTEYEFLDYTPKLIDLQKKYYYRVSLVRYQSDIEVQRFSSDIFSWEGALDFVGLYIVEEHLFLYRWVSGVPCFIYKKKHDGDRCTVCWDDILQRVTKSNCTVCFGTGRLGGYYPPIPAWANIEPLPNLAQVAQQGLIQPSKTDFQFTDYPSLRPDDLILEVKTNVWWKVVNVRSPEKNRDTMLQVAGLDAVNRADIEYQLIVDENERKKMIADLEARKLIREF